MKNALTLIFSGWALTALSQTPAGFQLLEKVAGSRVAALGGYTSSIPGDVALFFQNPSVLDSATVGQLVTTYNPFFADIQGIYAQYGWAVKGLPMAAGVRYIDYGNILQTDASGNTLGEVQAQDYVVTIGAAHQVGPFTLGSNFHWIHSGLAGYNADALAVDLGGLYQAPNTDLSVGMTIRNLGTTLSNFTDQAIRLPTGITLGITFRPEHMPVRFTLTGHDLTDIASAFYSADDNLNLADQFFTRVVIGGEFLISKHFNALIGYDHNRKRELRLDETAGGAGWSYGFLLRLRAIEFRFSRATYQAAGGTSFIAIQTNTKELTKRF